MIVTPPFQDSKLDPLYYDVALIRFLREIDASLAYQKMLDGIADNYKDETGIDTGLSTGQSKGTNLYTPSANPCKLLLHMDGNDNGVAFPVSSYPSRTATVLGSARTKTAEKVFGTASLFLEGTTSYITFPTSPDFNLLTNNFTIQMRIKPTDITGTRGLFCRYQDASNYDSFYIFNGRMAVYSNRSGAVINKTTAVGNAIAANTWSAITFERVGNSLNFYVNGALIDTATITGANLSAITGALNIGHNPDGNDFFKGYIDEVRLLTSSGQYNGAYTLETAAFSDTTAYNNMSIQSAAFSAISQPARGRIVIFEGDIDTPTLNTDLLAWISRDGGTTWSQVTLTAAGTYASGKNIIVGSVDLNSQPAGTSMKYKITTPTGKAVNIYGASMLWA